MKAAAKLKDEARKHELKEEWEQAIDAYREVLRNAEGGEIEAELPLFNRVGDLCVRLGKPVDAVTYYEQAADHYAEAGLYNNAIALCNKALRYLPNRLELLRKLGQFSAAQGFLTDARRWYLEYAERQLKQGALDDAFTALEDFATVYEDAEIRELLGRQLRTHNRIGPAIIALKRAHALRLQVGEQLAADALKAEILQFAPSAFADGATAPADGAPQALITPTTAPPAVPLAAAAPAPLAPAVPLAAAAPLAPAVPLAQVEPDGLGLESAASAAFGGEVSVPGPNDAVETAGYQEFGTAAPEATRPTVEFIESVDAAFEAFAPDLDEPAAPDVIEEPDTLELEPSEFADENWSDQEDDLPVLDTETDDLPLLEEEIVARPERTEPANRFELDLSEVTGPGMAAAAVEPLPLLDFGSESDFSEEVELPLIDLNALSFDVTPRASTAPGFEMFGASMQAEPESRTTPEPNAPVRVDDSAPRPLETINVADVDWARPPVEVAPGSLEVPAFEPELPPFLEFEPPPVPEAMAAPLNVPEPRGFEYEPPPAAYRPASGFEYEPPPGFEVEPPAGREEPQAIEPAPPPVVVPVPEADLPGEIAAAPKSWAEATIEAEPAVVAHDPIRIEPQRSENQAALVVYEPEPIGFEAAYEPEATVVEPKPVAFEPEPIALEPEPEPVRPNPEPVAFEPVPETIAFEPEIVAFEPEIVAFEPEPIAFEPKTVVFEPETVAFEPAFPEFEPEAPRVMQEPPVFEQEPRRVFVEPTPPVLDAQAEEPDTPQAAEPASMFVAAAVAESRHAMFEEPVPAVLDAATEFLRLQQQIDLGDSTDAVPRLDALHSRLAEAGKYREAWQACDALLRFEPASVKVLQQRVEYASALGDRDLLLRSYLELARQLMQNGAETKGRVIYQRVLDIEPQHVEARKVVHGAAPAQTTSGYVDLFALISEEDEEASTRFVVAEKAPTGDEDRDFADMLSQFKQKVSENLSLNEGGAHYDLGLAFKEMGLIDEAIAEFQTAIKGGEERLKIYEELGQCFLLKQQYNVAVNVLSRALQMAVRDEGDLIGVYYTLGRTHEELGQGAEARAAYEHVIGIDINFQDATRRLANL